MMKDISQKTINILFSICFSSIIFIELGKLFNNPVINIIFVIMSLCLMGYVYKVLESDG